MLNSFLTAEIEYVNGFAIVGSYAVTGKWSEDETLRKNYNVIFTGNLGEDGELKILLCTSRREPVLRRYRTA